LLFDKFQTFFKDVGFAGARDGINLIRFPLDLLDSDYLGLSGDVLAESHGQATPNVLLGRPGLKSKGVIDG